MKIIQRGILRQRSNKESFKTQYRLAIGNFLAEFANFVPSFISAIFANSIVVWTDCFASFGAVVHFFIVILATRQMKNDDGVKYNFGVARLETMAAFMCDMLLVIGYTVVLVVAVFQLFNPSAPNEAIVVFLVLKAINITMDVVFLIQAKKAQRLHPSRLNETELANEWNALYNDVVVGIIATVCFAFSSYKWSWYVSPIATIILSLYFSYSAIKRIRDEFKEITDVSTAVENQDEIIDLLLEYRSAFNKINAVNCHYLNHKLCIYIVVTFRNEITYEEQMKLLNDMSAKVYEKFTNSEIRFVLEADEEENAIEQADEKAIEKNN